MSCATLVDIARSGGTSRTVAMAAMLLVVYVALSFLNDDHGFLGTDTGGKVATLRAMDHDHDLRPDVGYWAAQWDPDGSVHPLFDTRNVKGRWLQVTTLPVLYAGLPLYAALGYRGALLLPMLGSVAAALAISTLAVRLGSTRRWAVFWIAGVASPLTIYALDFWEHSIGVALLLWAAVALFDAVEGRSWRALVAGALVGVAFLMRTEALVYGAIGGAVALGAVVRAGRDAIAGAVRVAIEFAVGAALAVAAGAALEVSAVGKLIRLGRANEAAKGAGSGGGALPGSRVSDAIATTVNLRPSLDAASYVAGAAVVVLIVAIVALSRRELDDRERRVLAGFGFLVAGLYAVRFAQGLGFVPGLFAATPIAAVALVLGWTSASRRTITALALAALPFMWLFQFVGGATPQWAGRYELPTTMLLLTVGLVALESVRRWIAVSLVTLSLVVTLFGALWLRERSHSVADAMRDVQRLPQPVLVSDIAHLFREGAAFYEPDRHWLTAVTGAQQDEAADVVRRAGFTQFGFIAPDDEVPRDFAGFRRGATQTIALFSDVTLRVTTYDAA